MSDAIIIQGGLEKFRSETFVILDGQQQESSLMHLSYCVGPPADTMKLEFLESPSSTLLEYSRISNLLQAHFWDFLEIACWYWPDLTRIQVTKLGLSKISLNFKKKCEFQVFPIPLKSKPMLTQWS